MFVMLKALGIVWCIVDVLPCDIDQLRGRQDCILHNGLGCRLFASPRCLSCYALPSRLGSFALGAFAGSVAYRLVIHGDVSTSMSALAYVIEEL